MFLSIQRPINETNNKKNDKIRAIAATTKLNNSKYWKKSYAVSVIDIESNKYIWSFVKKFLNRLLKSILSSFVVSLLSLINKTSLGRP